MNDQELSLLWIGAFRHYLRQQTAAASEFVSVLSAQWETLPTATQEVIAAELSDAFAQDAALRANPDQIIAYSPLGADCNRHCWEYVRVLCNG